MARTHARRDTDRVADTLDITVIPGETWTLSVQWSSLDDGPVKVKTDTTGCTARMQVRRAYTDDLLADIWSALPASDDGTIVVSDDGRFDLVINAETTELMRTASLGVWDLFCTFPGSPIRRRQVVRGKVAIGPATTVPPT